MLWRSTYQTRTVENPAVPEVELAEGEILIGLFDPEGFQIAELWRRLLKEELPRSQVVIGLIGETWAKVKSQPGDIFAGSFMASSRNIESSGWQSALELETPQTFAYCRSGSRSLLMIGPPTEDALDQFRSFALMAG